MGRFFRGFFAAPLALLPIASYAISAFGGIYWIYITVHLSKWLWLVVGLVIPPVGVIGGILAYLGIIFQPSPAARAEPSADDLRRSFATLSGVVATAERCRWPDVTASDIASIAASRDMVADMLRKDHGLTDREAGMIDGAVKGAASTISCDDKTVHGSVRDMLDQVAARSR